VELFLAELPAAAQRELHMAIKVDSD
ncbi:uncharacterized protein METZ01_LOCUS112421, partial [marine metagenome]